MLRYNTIKQTKNLKACRVVCTKTNKKFYALVLLNKDYRTFVTDEAQLIGHLGQGEYLSSGRQWKSSKKNTVLRWLTLAIMVI